MTQDNTDIHNSSESMNLIHSYFPDTSINDKAITEQQIDAGEILFDLEKILPYLQTIFFEEHLLELQLDQSTRLFFTHLLDDIPDITDDVDENSIDEYEPGSYLKETDNFIIAPLSPGIGNARIRACKQVIIRFYMGTTAVELGCTFRDTDMVKDIPVLRLNFPEIVRINRQYRSFRVKVITGVDAQISILRPMIDNITEKFHKIEDISTMGLAFLVLTKERDFEIGNQLSFNIQVPGVNDLEVEGTIRRISNARDNKGILKICGVQFDLETRSLATEIERIAASTQRLQLREISEKTAGMRGIRLMK